MSTGKHSIPQRWNLLPNFVRLRPKLITALLVLGAVAFAAGVLWDARRDALNNARVSAANLAALLHEQTTIAFRTTDLALRAVEQRLESEDLAQDDPGFRDYLRMMNAKLDYVRAVYVIGPDGFIAHDTDYPETPRVSLADRDYFRALQRDPGDAMFIGPPLLSRSVKRWFVPVARRIEYPDGSFAGIVAAAVEPLFFERTYGRLRLREHDAIGLFNADSTLIARVPPRPDLYGRRLDQFRLFTEELPRAPEGVYEIANAFSGRASIVGFEKVADLPLVVTAVIDRRAALSGWRRLVAMIGLACLSIVVLILLLHATWAKRQLEVTVARQKALMHDKLESIGYMTSSVAHDFKNLLAAIAAGVRIIRKKGPDDQLLAGIEDAVERGNRLTTGLLQFARNQEFDRSQFDPNARIEGLATLLRQATSGDVRLRLDLAPGLGNVSASPAFFDASLINLAVNASHAMPDGGDVRVSTRAAAVDGDAFLNSGTYAAISVADNGCGIPASRLADVFEPFVTSKKGSGTGLGLFQVRRFAVEAGGDVRITSSVGVGTTVEILLPHITS